jgi:hypothetical protein
MRAKLASAPAALPKISPGFRNDHLVPAIQRLQTWLSKETVIVSQPAASEESAMLADGGFIAGYEIH